MARRLVIGNKAAAAGSVYVIAELGVNHDGSVDRALSMVETAARAGVDAIKLQLFDADLLMSRASKLAAYQKSAGEKDPLAMLKRLQLSAEQMVPVVKRAKERGLNAIVTVFSEQLVPQAEKIGFDAYKTASPDIVHKPLLEALARTGKPLIVSTGAATMDEVTRAIGWLGECHAAGKLAVLQCVSSYPTPLAQAELGGIRAIAKVFDGPVGYSDHTSDTRTGALAASLGAVILEKHFTYDTDAQGPDHAASLNEYGMRAYVKHAREGKVAPPTLPEVKRVLPIEEDVRRVSRQSVVLTRAMRAGEYLGAGDVVFKRPGTGVQPWEAVIGRRLKRDIETDMPVMREDLE